MEDYICGRNSVLELLKTDTEIDKLFVQKGELKGSINMILAKAREKKIVIIEADKRKLSEMAEGTVHQGVIALVSGYKFHELDDVIREAKEKKGVVRLIILDEIEDPHNLGAIIRTGEAAGFDGVIIGKRRSSAVTATVHKASAGATSHMKVCKVTNIGETVNKLKEKNIWVYGADGYADTMYTDVNFKGDVCLVIGNEGRGITDLVKKRCDGLVKLPMLGNVESLNASNAAAILIYEVVRQNA